MSDKKNWTAQEVFDTPPSGILNQGRRCVGGDGHCMYRFNGMKCAAGFIFSNKEVFGRNAYNSDHIIEHYAQHLKNHQSLIWKLQGIHDEYFPLSWPRHLRRLATQHGLSSEVVDEWERSRK